MNSSDGGAPLGAGVPRSPRRRLVIGAVTAAAVAAAAFFVARRDAPAPAAGGAASDAPASAAAGISAPLSARQVERGIENARASVQRNPKDASGWAMLAHSYEMAGRYDLASSAYEQLLKLRPADAQAHADAAAALARSQHGSLLGAPARLIARALSLAPTNLQALVLGGSEAFERRAYADAIGLWQRALAVTTDGTLRRPIETRIAEARALAAPSAPGASAAGGLAFVTGRVVVAEALKSRIAPDDTVFVYARPLQGSRMPVALLRRHGRDLPLDFALDDTLAMVPQVRLSQQAQVMVGVRVSRRGDAIPAAGDLEAELGPVPLGATGLELEIAHARP